MLSLSAHTEIDKVASKHQQRTDYRERLLTHFTRKIMPHGCGCHQNQ
jgi:hypothetical protein